MSPQMEHGSMRPLPPPPRSRRAEGDVRTRLMDSAIAHFGERGFGATSVQEIVDGAHLTKGAFYHHFSSKEEVLLLIHDEYMDYELQVIERIEALNLAPEDALVALLTEVAVSVDEFRPHMKIFFEERRFLSTAAFARVKEKRDAFEKAVVDLLERGIRTGAFRPVPDVRLAAFGVIGMVSWTYHWYRPGGTPAAEIGRMYADLLLTGLRSPDASPRPADTR